MLVEQSSYLANRDGRVTPDEQAVLDAVAKGAAAVRALTPADADNREPILNAPRAYWLDLRAYDPVAAAKALVGPLFVLQGERDYQVTMTDFAGWQAGLTGKPNVTLRSYPSLNHLFMTGTGPSSPEEYGEPGHVSRAVIDDLAQWVKTN
jgi:fermentation-respiration switch protein FrsA (DUF1100 family)